MTIPLFKAKLGGIMGFTHLHTHTEYSLLDGSSKIKELVAYAKELGMNSLAITDHGVMYGVVEFYKVAKQVGIKPILGCEVYVAPGSRFDREKGTGEERYYHLILLAENNIGYANLMKIVSRGFIDGFYYKPRVDFEILEKYHQGIIVLSACLGGEIPNLLMKGKYEKAKEIALLYEKTFGKYNYYLELQDHGIPEQRLVNQDLIRMSKETGIPLVATNDVHYIHKEDWEAHDILLCVQTAKKVQDENRMRYQEGEFYLRSEQEMRELFPYIQEALDNTEKIAQRCNVELEFGILKLPEYPLSENLILDIDKEWNMDKKDRAMAYLRQLCQEGLYKRYTKVEYHLQERLDFELSVIESMGYVDYFLIVWDFVNYAKKQNIPVGPGRGSAAGSIASYCLGITDVDPIQYQLLFERFLNPERISMPDIDIDFCYERRQEVIDYVVEKYGKDKVCQIITFGTMAARGVIRDVGRAMDISYAKCDMIAKLVPTELDMTLKKALIQSNELNGLYQTDEEVQTLIDMSMKLEGLPRHSSIHAAGIVISKKEIDEYVPVAKGVDGSITTQFTMGTLEELGLLKMDFLGLRTLTVIQNTVEQIQKNYGKKIDILSIDYEDKKVYESIGTGRTEGIFQIESSGMQSFMQELQPECLEDLVAGISLYRPGPMDFIPKYIKGKKNKKEITYDCKELEPILMSTYGCIVYQEQVMQIVRDLAGYTLGRSDLVRRAMSKKISEVMQKERQNFIYGNEKEGIRGCIATGIEEKIAHRIFDEMMEFAKYAFNKSHAVCYAMVSYQTAWLKYYYPKEFMAALLTSVIDNQNKIQEYILECKQMGIAILPPDVNQGGSGFQVSNKGILFGLSAIKGVGHGVTDKMVRERELHGKFTSLDHFVERMTGREVNKRTLENLIKAGALDSLEGNRRQKIMVIGDILEQKSKAAKKSITGQMSLFDMVSGEEKKAYQIKMPKVVEYSKYEILAYEKEVIGMYISGHPLEEYIEQMKKYTNAKTIDFFYHEGESERKFNEKEPVVIGGIITKVSKKITRNGQEMAFLTVEDLIGSIEVIVFPKVYKAYKSYLMEDEKVYVSGKVQIGDEQDSRLILDSVKPFEEYIKELWLQYMTMEEYQQDEIRLLKELKENPGRDKVYIYIRNIKRKKELAIKITLNSDLICILERRLGQENVKCITKLLKR